MTSATAQFATHGFGPENLPYAAYSPSRWSGNCGSGSRPRLGARLGDRIIDLGQLADRIAGLSRHGRDAIRAPNLDRLLAAGHVIWGEVRSWLAAAVQDEAAGDIVAAASHLVADVALHLPFTVADYVDFYASEEHARNVGRMFRPDDAPLFPNWKHLPIGYHGRAGTIRLSGEDVRRPNGLRPGADGIPCFGACRQLDIESEIGFVLGGSAPRGGVSIRQAATEHLFGAVLLNDWSARDIQAFEYRPLGPNLGKSFASSISPWVVPWTALSAAFVAPPVRTVDLADYLDDSIAGPFGLDITMEVLVDHVLVSRPPVRTMYWTAPQLVAHMTVNGAALRPGDFLGSGTVSGPGADEWGSLIELTRAGTEPVPLEGGRSVGFLEDGHTVTLRGSAPGPDGSIIDFGECSARIVVSDAPVDGGARSSMSASR